MVRTKQTDTYRRKSPGKSLTLGRKQAKLGGKSPVKKRKTKPGSVAMREIRHYQHTTHMLIQKQPFMRLVKEILDDMFPVGYSAGFRWQSNAIAALQEVAESYLINLFEYSNIVANNSKRVTVMLRDMQVVRRIRHFDDIVNR